MDTVTILLLLHQLLSFSLSLSLPLSGLSDYDVLNCVYAFPCFCRGLFILLHCPVFFLVFFLGTDGWTGLNELENKPGFRTGHDELPPSTFLSTLHYPHGSSKPFQAIVETFHQCPDE